MILLSKNITPLKYTCNHKEADLLNEINKHRNTFMRLCLICGPVCVREHLLTCTTTGHDLVSWSYTDVQFIKFSPSLPCTLNDT